MGKSAIKIVVIRPMPRDEKCTKCRRKLKVEYGFCRHGLGAFYRCMKCGRVFGFTPDTE